MSETDMFSSSTKELLGKVRMMVPPMLEKFHKGQLGRVAVIGGSQDYTGAPYFSAMASARLGADLSHVICDPDAGQVIKTYSPNLMVHPWMRAAGKNPFSTSASSIAEPIIDLFPRLHALVIGPGLGRDPLMQETVACVVAEARKQNIPMVLDADALLLVMNKPELVKGYRECILTPNVVEFGRLAKAMNVDTGGDQGEGCAKLAHALGGVLIVRKGGHDYISNGDKTVVSDIEGGRKRAGGQGDTLTGSMGTLLAWRAIYIEGLWDTEGNLSKDDLLMLAAFGASCITRECSRLAFRKMGRALQASDLTDEVPVAFEHLIGEKEESKM